jgi:hypothetical protein
MRKNSAWLAAGLLVFVVLACKYSAGTNSNSAPTPDHYQDHDGERQRSGEPGDETNTFTPGDHKLHCLVPSKNRKEGTKVTFLWWVVDAAASKTRC